MITAKTKICMVIGDPIAHSLSPQIHNTGYKALQLDYVFIATQVTPENLRDFMQGIRKTNIQGLSCTLPHKITVMKYLDQLDDTAKTIGAVNTIINQNGILKGFNTDWLGIINPITKRIKLKNKMVAIIGAGGAARAAAYGVTKQGAKLNIYNRTLAKAKQLAKEFGGEGFGFENFENIKIADVIINTTPVGMDLYTKETPVPKKYLLKKHIVFDTIYTPQMTRLLIHAKEKDATIIMGTEMFLEQAVAQFKLFTDKYAPMTVMKKVL